MTDRETVNKTERMKVTTCLNPLHTPRWRYGCMLGYTLICDEMKDETLVKLVKRLGYVEGLPVVVDPVILSPKAFIDEVVEQRLPNPFMPDSPQRIATDTSQKVGIRFGETIKSYVEKGRDLHELTRAFSGDCGLAALSARRGRRRQGHRNLRRPDEGRIAGAAGGH